MELQAIPAVQRGHRFRAKAHLCGALLLQHRQGGRGGESLRPPADRPQERTRIGKKVPEHETWYRRYFEITTTPKRGAKVAVKAEAVARGKRCFGFFALLSNETMDAVTTLELYATRIWRRRPSATSRSGST